MICLDTNIKKYVQVAASVYIPFNLSQLIEDLTFVLRGFI